MTRSRFPLALLLLPILCAAQRGISAEDYLAFNLVSDPQTSPDGQTVAYVQTSIDTPLNRRVSAIWMAAADGATPPAQFSTSPQSATSPRRSAEPDGSASLSSAPAGPP